MQLPQLPMVQTLSAEEKAELQQAADWCRTQCTSLQKSLARMQGEAAQAVRLLQFIESLEKEEAEITDNRQRWYESQRYASETKLVKNSRYQQVKLEVKIAALQAEAITYEGLLSGA